MWRMPTAPHIPLGRVPVARGANVPHQPRRPGPAAPPAASAPDPGWLPYGAVQAGDPPAAVVVARYVARQIVPPGARSQEGAPPARSGLPPVGAACAECAELLACCGAGSGGAGANAPGSTQTSQATVPPHSAAVRTSRHTNRGRKEEKIEGDQTGREPRPPPAASGLSSRMFLSICGHCAVQE